MMTPLDAAAFSDLIARFNALLQRQEALVGRISVEIKVITASPYTVVEADDGKMLRWDGTATLTVRLPPALPAGWRAGLLQMSSGKIQPVAMTGATLIHDQGYVRTRAAGSQANVIVGRNTGGTAAEWVLGGSVVA